MDVCITSVYQRKTSGRKWTFGWTLTFFLERFLIFDLGGGGDQPTCQDGSQTANSIWRRKSVAGKPWRKPAIRLASISACPLSDLRPPSERRPLFHTSQSGRLGRQRTALRARFPLETPAVVFLQCSPLQLQKGSEMANQFRYPRSVRALMPRQRRRLLRRSDGPPRTSGAALI